MNKRFIIALSSFLLLMPVGISIEDVEETSYSIEPNMCIDYPFYDIHSTNTNELIHSSCEGPAPGISFGRTSWFKQNWCHQMRGDYLSG